MKTPDSIKLQFVTATVTVTEMGYGLAIGLPNGETAVYRDLSLNKEKIEKYAEVINKNEVSDLHIRDVIEDLME